MGQSIAIFAGFSSMYLWLRTGCSLILCYASAYNGSLAIAVSFAASLGACAVAGNRLGGRLDRLALGAGMAGALAGAGFLVLPDDGPGVAFLCAQAVCMPPLALAWGRRFALASADEAVSAVGGATLLSAAVQLVGSASAAFATAVLPMALPVVSAACLLALSRGDAREAALWPVPSERLSLSARMTAFWESPQKCLAAFLCLSSFASSFFVGVTANPYLANSFSMRLFSALTTIAVGAVMAAAYLAVRRSDGRWASSDEGTAGGAGSAAAAMGEPGVRAIPLALFQVLCLGLLLLLVVGLFLLSTKTAGSLTVALGLVSGAGNGLMLLFWLFVPRALFGAGEEPEGDGAAVPVGGGGSLRAFACYLAMSGAVFARYAGTQISKLSGAHYDALSVLATLFVVVVMALTVLYFASYIAYAAQQAAKGAPQPAPAPGDQPLSYEDVSTVLRERRLRAIEPYGLTERESEITLLLLDGQTLGGIAQQLFITERTVKFHSRNAYEKLGVHSKKELMMAFSDLSEKRPD